MNYVRAVNFRVLFSSPQTSLYTEHMTTYVVELL